MLDNIIFYTLPFILSFANSFFIIPRIKEFAKDKKFFDRPDSRKSHTAPIVNLGGVGIFISFMLGVIITKSLGIFIFESNNIFNVFFIGCIGFFLIGFFDDLKPSSPFFRLGLEIILVIFLFNNGIKLELLNTNIYSDSFLVFIFNFINLFVTILWICGTANAINWIDGLDGLSTSYVIVNIVGLILITGNSSMLLTLISSALLGSCIAFLYFNLKKDNIFMGDGGSYFLGFTLASLPLLILNTNGAESILPYFNQNIFFAIIINLSYPLLDMCSVIIQRINKGKSIFFPDRCHIHHVLLNYGFDKRIVVYKITLFSIWMTSISYCLIDIQNRSNIFFLISFIFIIFNYFFKRQK